MKSQVEAQPPVVVTGGASGIGACVVDRVVAGGGRAVVLDRVKPAGDVTFVECDLSDRTSIAEAVAILPVHIGALANVAGVSGVNGAQLAFEVNFLGLRELTEALLPRIVDGGAIVNVASTAGANWRLRTALLQDITGMDWPSAVHWFQAQGLDGTTTYDLSKELVVYYGQLVAGSRFAIDRVRINTVSPGPVATPLLAEFKETMGAASLGRLRDLVGRDAEPDEIAAVVLFLLSEEASWINGVDLHVDGGVEAAFNVGVLSDSRTVAHRLG